MIWFRIGMFDPLLLLAFLAAERSVATAFPHPTEWPLLSETDTGASSPMTPANKSTAPTPRINRRSVMVSPFVVGDFDAKEINRGPPAVNPTLTPNNSSIAGYPPR